MAAPHVSAVAALIASDNYSARHDPEYLTSLLKDGVNTDVHNETPPLSATDISPTDRTGDPCSHGYCHLGGKAIPDNEAYGAGLVNAYLPL